MPVETPARARWRKVRRHMRKDTHLIRATTFGYRLLGQANSDLGIVGAYHDGRTRNEDVSYIDPNVLKKAFLAKTGVLLERANHAYLLQPGQQQAVTLFRAFHEYAATADWQSPESFAALMDRYEQTRQQMIGGMTAAQHRRTELAVRRANKTSIPVDDYVRGS